MKTSLVIPLFVLGIASNGEIALGQSSGTFTATGSLSGPREFHTATLLTNGKVLIAGGFGAQGPVWANSELYDPSTRTFTAVSSMTTPRYMHTATLLPSGKVLIAGGWKDSAGQVPTHSAELYDPSSGTFTATGDMTTGRRLHTATLLNNGKVLIAGGRSHDTHRSAELYDPSTGIFSATGNMTEPGAETATLLPSGQVLITRSVVPAQQRGGDQFKPNHAELYHPATGTFTRTGDMIDQNTGELPTAMLLANGKVLIAGGGLWDLGGSTSAEIYDPATGAFSVTGKMSAGIDIWQAAALLPDGKVLIAGRGNFRGIGAGQGTTILYDPVTGTFGAPNDSQSAEGHAATLLPDGTILLSGGWVCCGYSIATAEVYQPAVLVASPVLFSVSGDGQGPGAILHAGASRLVSSSDPAVAGEALEIYGGGFISGGAIPPQVAIGGQMAEVLFFGTAPGFAGLNQMNVRVPSGVAPGPDVSVRLNYLNRPSNEVTVALR